MPVIGVDPGFNGALVCIDDDKSIICSYAMPTEKLFGTNFINPTRLTQILSGMVSDWDAGIMFIEDIWQGKELIRGWGVVQSCALSLGIDVVSVKPKAHQMFSLNKLNGGDKSLAVAWCRHRYPNEDFTKNGKVWEDKAEALIIANCGLSAYNVLGRVKLGNKITRRMLGYG